MLTESGASAAPARGLVEEVQLDATVSDDGHIVIAQAFGSIGRAVGAQNIGSSLCDLLEDREGLKVGVEPAGGGGQLWVDPPGKPRLAPKVRPRSAQH